MVAVKTSAHPLMTSATTATEDVDVVAAATRQLVTASTEGIEATPAAKHRQQPERKGRLLRYRQLPHRQCLHSGRLLQENLSLVVHEGFASLVGLQFNAAQYPGRPNARKLRDATDNSMLATY